jgi:hypothetical protein
MATTSTALVPLGDRDYLMKIVERNASDKADVLNPLTGLEAKALSDVALVTAVEAVGEAWQHARNYINRFIVGHLPVFLELQERIIARRRAGKSPLIVNGQPCDEFKKAITLLLHCDPSYFYKVVKKITGKLVEKKALPEPETTMTETRVDPEPDAQDAEVVDDNIESMTNEMVERYRKEGMDAEVGEPDQPVAMPSGESVAKIHEAASEPEPQDRGFGIFPTLTPDQLKVLRDFVENHNDEELRRLVGKALEAVWEGARNIAKDAEKEVMELVGERLRSDLRPHLLASFPDLAADEDEYIGSGDERAESLKEFLRTLPRPFVQALTMAAIDVGGEMDAADGGRQAELRKAAMREKVNRKPELAGHQFDEDEEEEAQAA